MFITSCNSAQLELFVVVAKSYCAGITSRALVPTIMSEQVAPAKIAEKGMQG
jgi:hypothetical protein